MQTKHNQAVSSAYQMQKPRSLPPTCDAGGKLSAPTVRHSRCAILAADLRIPPGA